MDNNNSKIVNNTRKLNDESYQSVNIEREVSELIKKNGNKVSMTELRNKYSDDKIFDMIQEAYFEKLSLIRKRAVKFTKLIERKYGTFGYPLHIILNKALKYKKKYNLDEDTFELFRQHYLKSLNMRNNPNKYDVLVPNTNMAKVFGDDPYNNNKIHINDSDHRIVKEIINLYDLNRANWQQVTLQSITYEYFYSIMLYNLNQKNKDIDPKITNFSSFIHPVIAAMFLPKISKFDEYFLFTNLAYILRCKYLGEPITTYHNYLMLYNLVTDPTDVVCSADSPLKDIINRVLLQINLWKNVLRLRQGGFYDTYNSFVAADLMVNIDNCKLSTYDAPDLMMIGDENVMIRRLLNSLSFRCATIYSIPTTIPLFNPTNMGYNQNLQVSTLHIPVNYTQVSKVPMIYIRLLPTLQQNLLGQNNQNNQNITVQNALSTTQPIMYNGKLESRIMTVVSTDNVLIVVIPRRTYKPLSSNIYNLPAVFNFANMPHHAFGLEVLNNTKVLVDKMITVGNDDSTKPLANKLVINSVVSLKEKDDPKGKFIYGSKTFIFDHDIGGFMTVYDPIQNNAPINNPLRMKNDSDRFLDFITHQTILIYTNCLNNYTGFANTNHLGGAEALNERIPYESKIDETGEYIDGYFNKDKTINKNYNIKKLYNDIDKQIKKYKDAKSNNDKADYNAFYIYLGDDDILNESISFMNEDPFRYVYDSVLIDKFHNKDEFNMNINMHIENDREKNLKKSTADADAAPVPAGAGAGAGQVGGAQHIKNNNTEQIQKLKQLYSKLFDN